MLESKNTIFNKIFKLKLRTQCLMTNPYVPNKNASATEFLFTVTLDR